MSREMLDEAVPGWESLSLPEFRVRLGEFIGRQRATLRAAYDAACADRTPAEPEAAPAAPARSPEE